MRKNKKGLCFIAVREYGGDLLVVDADDALKPYIGKEFTTDKNGIPGKDRVPKERGVYMVTCAVKPGDEDHHDVLVIVGAELLFTWAGH